MGLIDFITFIEKLYVFHMHDWKKRLWLLRNGVICFFFLPHLFFCTNFSDISATNFIILFSFFKILNTSIEAKHSQANNYAGVPDYIYLQIIFYHSLKITNINYSGLDFFYRIYERYALDVYIKIP